ncbi:MAG: UDP-N-acetylmuramoyl-L-alanine--D-glutamate ligase [Ignavibacteria bacterium]
MKTDLRDTRISIIGAARSGIAASMLAARKGAKVFLSDSSSPKLSDEILNQLRNLNVEIEFGNHSVKVFDCDFIVTSPGVPVDSEVLIRARSQGIPIYSEIEFASWFAKGRIIGITGTNGKTTTTALIHHILKNSGFKTVIGGNIGDPFSNVVEQTDEKTISVLEVSSYQLDLIESFHPNVAIILNISPDHLDRYENNFSKYIASKFRITKNLGEEDLFIYNKDDGNIVNNFSRGKFLTQSFSAFDTSFATIFLANGKIYLRERNNIDLPETTSEKLNLVIDVNEMLIKGIHNYYNAMAATLAAKFMGCDLKKIAEGLSTFRGVEHRLEVVRILDGVTYINDSKATNVRSTYYALKSYDSNIILILGGREKDNDYDEIKDLVKERVKLIFAFGESRDKIKNYFDGIKQVIVCNSLNEVVKEAHKKASPGDVVLFSPSCKSFDQFNDFEHRGKTFKELVNQL